MKHPLKRFFALFATIVLADTTIQAAGEKKMVIKTRTGSYKLAAGGVV